MVLPISDRIVPLRELLTCSGVVVLPPLVLELRPEPLKISAPSGPGTTVSDLDMTLYMSLLSALATIRTSLNSSVISSSAKRSVSLKLSVLFKPLPERCFELERSVTAGGLLSKLSGSYDWRRGASIM